MGHNIVVSLSKKVPVPDEGLSTGELGGSRDDLRIWREQMDFEAQSLANIVGQGGESACPS